MIHQIIQGDVLRGLASLPDESVQCVVLDPFGGSGTVVKVARDLKRDWILIELNPAYVQMARRRLRLDESLEKWQ